MEQSMLLFTRTLDFPPRRILYINPRIEPTQGLPTIFGGCPDGVHVRHTPEMAFLQSIPSSAETCPALSRGVSLGSHSIKLYTFAYKFISNLHHYYDIVPSTPPPCISLYRRRHNLQLIVLPSHLQLFQGPSGTFDYINTTRKCLQGDYPSSIDAGVQD